MNNTAHSAIRAAALDADTIGPVVSRWQTVAELRVTVPVLPVVLHDVGPVDAWGTKTYLDIELRNGAVRLGSAHDTEGEKFQNDRGYTHSIELPAGMTGQRLAEALAVAEARMPEVVAGFGEADGEGVEPWAGLTTDESRAALKAIRVAVATAPSANDNATRVEFELSAATDVDELTDERPALAPFRAAIRQMIEVDHSGRQVALVDCDEPLDEAGHVVSGDARVDILFLEAEQQAAIVTNGPIFWIDATSVEDALEAFHAGLGQIA